LRRIQKEISDLTTRPLTGITVEPDESNLYHWSCVIKASADSPYKNGKFKFNIVFPETFPFKPPEVAFVTKIYHPGINEKGEICIAILRDEWKPSISISSVLSTVQEKLNNPSADDPYEPDIAAELKSNHAKFLSVAKDWTKKFAN